MKILAMSSSRINGGGYLEGPDEMMHDFLGTHPQKIAFIPFASVDDYEDYASQVQKALAHLPYQLLTVREDNAPAILQAANVIMVGGGNTFKLLHTLQALGLTALIQEKVKSGTPYIGWSAGANLAGLTIGTTNDMPIVQPQSFNALGFFPFQINPHYFNFKYPGFHGETRDQRLEEFVKTNPHYHVIALPEGTALHYEDGILRFLGTSAGVLFQLKNKEVIKNEIKPGEVLDFLR